MENVFITISPTPDLIELTDHWLKPEWGNCLDESENYYDVCIYVPRTESWFYLKAIKDDGLFNSLTPDSGHCYQYISDKICGAYSYHFEDNVVYMHSMKDFTFRVTYFSDLHDDIAPNERISNHNQCAITTDETVYLLVKVLVFDKEEIEEFQDIKQVYFRCYKHVGGHSWSFLYRTLSIDTADTHSKTAVLISSVTNEMLIVYTDQATHVFVAELSAESPEAIKLSMNDSSERNKNVNDASDIGETANPVDSTLDKAVGENDNIVDTKNSPRNLNPDVSFHILEGQDQLYIVEVRIPESSRVPIKVSCKFTYRYNSRVLADSNGPALYVDNDASGGSGNYPCHLGYVSSHGRSVWIFCGTIQDGSSLVEVRLDDKGELFTVRHTPPPFSRVLATVPGKISPEYIKLAKGIKDYISCACEYD